MNTGMMVKAMTDGWALPVHAPRAHYFREGQALCEKWSYFGQPNYPTPVSDELDRHTCMTCLKRSRQRKYVQR